MARVTDFININVGQALQSISRLNNSLNSIGRHTQGLDKIARAANNAENQIGNLGRRIRSLGGGRRHRAGLEGVGVAGFGLGYAAFYGITSASNYEAQLDKAVAARQEVLDQSNVTITKIQDQFREFIRQNTVDIGSTIRPLQLAEALTQISKDGLVVTEAIADLSKNISPLIDEITKEFQNSSDPTKVAQFNKATQERLEQYRKIGKFGTTEYISEIAREASQTARAFGDPALASEIADVFGDLLEKTIDTPQELKQVISDLATSKFSRTFAAVAQSTRFEGKDLIQALRNTVGTESRTNLPIDEILKLFSAFDRLGPSGLRVGTTIRRAFEELTSRSPANLKAIGQFFTPATGLQPQEFINKVSEINTAEGTLKFLDSLVKSVNALGEAKGVKNLAATAFSQLLGSDASKIISNLSDGVDAIGAFNERFKTFNIEQTIAIQEENLNSAALKFRSALDNFFQTLGFEGGFLGLITNFINDVTDMLNRLSTFFQNNPGLAKLLVIVGKAAALGLFFATIATGIGLFVSSIAVGGGISLALTGLVTGLSLLYDTIQQYESLRDFDPFVEIDNLGLRIREIIISIKDGFLDLYLTFRRLFDSAPVPDSLENIVKNNKIGEFARSNAVTQINRFLGTDSQEKQFANAISSNVSDIIAITKGLQGTGLSTTSPFRRGRYGSNNPRVPGGTTSPSLVDGILESAIERANKLVSDYNGPDNTKPIFANSVFENAKEFTSQIVGANNKLIGVVNQIPFKPFTEVDLIKGLVDQFNSGSIRDKTLSGLAKSALGNGVISSEELSDIKSTLGQFGLVLKESKINTSPVQQRESLINVLSAAIANRKSLSEQEDPQFVENIELNKKLVEIVAQMHLIMSQYSSLANVRNPQNATLGTGNQ